MVPEKGGPLPKDHSIELRPLAPDRGVIFPAGQGWTGNTVRMSSPLVVSREELDTGVDVFLECPDEIDPAVTA